MTDRSLAVVVLAAGQGTRMKSRTPKVLHRIGGRSLLGHVLATAGALDPQRVIVVVRHERDLVAAAVSDAAPAAVVVDQDEIPGTGRAVQSALAQLPDFAGDVLVLSADVPLLDADALGALLAQHRRGDAAATVLSATLDDATGYGRVIRDADGGVARIVEHKDADPAELLVTEINAGVYVFRAGPLREHLELVGTANAQGERYLTDVVGLLRASRLPVAAASAPDAAAALGVNDRVQLADAAARLNARTVKRWQLAGVTVLDPATTWIDVDATLAPDVTVLPNTHILRATAIAEGATVGPDTSLVDCEVGEGAIVTRTDATLAVIGAGASVGPFAYLRPGTELGDRGKIGTFVETKNARIGGRSKVPHLSYVGDAEVGEGANIGAGTIVANYDGVAKHRTEVGDEVRTGAHNVFVAPVRIGDGAYTGAGTVVRKDVPPGALAVVSGSQRNVEGWVLTHRPGTSAAQAAEKAAHGSQEEDG
ncbi:bifunctional UDP-N-acetylglucosamine diphosphorylase/glucosamine-1-phosphate N-acetyltransferase GlmU [Microbacterium sp. NPDC078428]|uniref:bifunctional UDP-N-acetylglucosamine diphosphorylase/glucosamine-1-phosphate N-acetyltransferase GlmU n=1 Tax=Microbacterium sp. NPDC078428 TaxID=3364190 RepID=UPI0037C98257